MFKTKWEENFGVSFVFIYWPIVFLFRSYLFSLIVQLLRSFLNETNFFVSLRINFKHKCFLCTVLRDQLLEMLEFVS